MTALLCPWVNVPFKFLYVYAQTLLQTSVLFHISIFSFADISYNMNSLQTVHLPCYIFMALIAQLSYCTLKIILIILQEYLCCLIRFPESLWFLRKCLGATNDYRACNTQGNSFRTALCISAWHSLAPCK